jgi:uncharacterized lipoprotein YmbA
MRQMLRVGLATGLMMAALVGCTSAPIHFYTLMLPPSDAAVPNASFAIRVEPVVVPAESDQAAWLVRVSPSEVAVLDGERWAAPLSDELRAAFAESLGEELGARDVEAGAAMKKKYTVQIVIRRFESVPGQKAFVAADWTVRSDSAAPLTCTSQASQSVAAGYPALAAGHQQIVRTIATQITAAVRGLESQQPMCP